MSNSLNLRMVNKVDSIAQGDNASTVVLELLDQYNLVLPYLNGSEALINFMNSKSEIVYQVTTSVFNSRVEFNVGEVLEFGSYKIEVRVYVDDSTYVFPSGAGYTLKINKSSDNYYTVAIAQEGIENVVSEVYARLEAENEGLTNHVVRKDNPHEVTKEQVGLDNVENVEQATKEEFDTHVNDSEVHVSNDDRDKWDSKLTQEDLDDALANFDTDVGETLTQHISNEEVHWQEGERDALKQSIADDIQSAVEDGKDDLLSLLSDKGIYGELPLIDDDERILEEKIYRKSDGTVVLNVTEFNYGGILDYQVRLSISVDSEVNSVGYSLYFGGGYEGEWSSNQVFGINEGNNSTAIGASAKAGGNNSTAIGTFAKAGGNNSIAIGRSASADEEGSVAIGYGIKAGGHASVSIGRGSQSIINYLGQLGGSLFGEAYWWRAHQFYAQHILGIEKEDGDTVRRYPAIVSSGGNTTIYTGKISIDEAVINTDVVVDLPSYMASKIRPDNEVIVTPNDDLALCMGKVTAGNVLVIKADKAGTYSYAIYYNDANVKTSTREINQPWPRL